MNVTFASVSLMLEVICSTSVLYRIGVEYHKFFLTVNLHNTNLPMRN